MTCPLEAERREHWIAVPAAGKVAKAEDATDAVVWAFNMATEAGRPIVEVRLSPALWTALMRAGIVSGYPVPAANPTLFGAPAEIAEDDVSEVVSA